MNKFFLIAFFFIPVLSSGQNEYDIAFSKSIPSNLGKPIHLPERGYNPYYKFDDTVDYRQKTRIFVVSEDSIYRKLYWRYTYTKDSIEKYTKANHDPWWINWMKEHLKDSLPDIDFTKYDLVMYSACGQCLAICEGKGPCHRSACGFREAWFIRDKPVDITQWGKDKSAFFTKTRLVNCNYIPGLPDLDNSDLGKFFEAGQYSSYQYIVSSDSLYYLIFSKYQKDSLPVVDFSKQELVVSISCPQCAVSCKDQGMGNTPCHRNACRYYSRWCVRDKIQGIRN